MRKLINKSIAVALSATLAVGTFFTGVTPTVKAEITENTEITTNKYPWTPVEGGTTGDYIADNYKGVESGHVFESVTQERLLDILSSKGNYYIVFGGPEHETSQKVLAAINEQAKADKITKIYHFDPYIDGYQIDITDAESPFKSGTARSNASVYQLWERIKELLPAESEALKNYQSSDTLLISVNTDGTGTKNEIKASYNLKNPEDFDAETAKSEIAKVFRGGKGDGAVVAGDVRTDYQFFKRVYNAGATFIETRQGDEPTDNRLGKATDIFTDADEEGFALHQVNFNELIDLLQSPEEHYIFFGASWCHNTQAIIGSVEKKAKANGKKVYVYDTTVGNQLTFGTGSEINTVKGTSSTFNSRNPVSDGHNISYVYGELVKYLGDYITENNSKKNNSIDYYPNGDLEGTATTVEPWKEATEGTVKNAIRLQMPFLIAYDKDAEVPVTKQWLHKNAANDGKYTEYMLELAWVLGTKEALENTDTKVYDGLTRVQFAAEAVKELSTVLGDKEPVVTEPGTSEKPETTPKPQETTTKTPETTTKGAETTSVPANTKVKAPGKAKINKITAKKKSAKKVSLTLKSVKDAKGYQVAFYKTKANAKKNKSAIVKKFVKKVNVTVTSKKLKNKSTLYVKARAYKLDGKTKVYGSWSSAKKVKIK